MITDLKPFKATCTQPPKKSLPQNTSPGDYPINSEEKVALCVCIDHDFIHGTIKQGHVSA